MRAGQQWVWGLVIVGVLVGVVAVQRALRDEPNAPPTTDAGSHEAAGATNGATSGSTTPDERVAPAPKPQTIVQWETSWIAAQKRARAQDRLVFLYVGLKPATCPPCRVLETTLFADRRIAALNRLVVPLYIRLDESAGSEERRLMQRIQLGTLPLLALITVEGGVIHRQRGGLYGAYDTDYQATTEAASVGQLSAPELLAVVRREIGTARRTTARMDALSRADSPAALAELAGLFVDRERYGDAVEALRRSLGKKDDAATRARMGAVLRQAGRRSEAFSAYQAALTSAPEHPDRIAWQLGLAGVRIEILAAEGEAKLDAADMEGELAKVISAATAAARLDVEARARAELAAHEQTFGRTKPVATQLDWFKQRFLDSEAVLEASLRWKIAHLAHGADRIDDAVAHLRRLGAEHPDSAAAQLMKHGTLDAWVREADGE